MSEPSTASDVSSAEKPPKTQPGLKLPPGMASQLGWFALRLFVAYTLVAIAIEAMSPLLELLIARGARNLLAFVSSPYYLKTIEFFEEGYAVTTWIGPLRGGFKLPSLMFVFAFSIGYVLALPGFFSLAYWLRACAVILISYFVCAFAVAIVSDARLTKTFLQFGIVLQPEWRSQFVDLVQYYLWMLTVRLYPLVMVIALTFESGAFRRRPHVPSLALRAMRWSTVGTLAVLLAVTFGMDPMADARIESVQRESISKRIEGLEARNPDIGPGLVKLGDFLLKQRHQRAALNAYRLAIDNLDGPAKRNAIETYDRVHEKVKQEMLEEARERRARKARAVN